jgi:predicted nucleic acid-binding protein
LIGKKYMPDRIFVDTNLLVYFISSEKDKKQKVKEIIFSNQEVYISSQVVNEFISVCLSKNLLELDEIKSLANNFMENLRFSIIKESTINKALQIKQHYKYSYWDSLILSSAIENDCSIIYSEDMQAGQVIENSLKILNPFNK